MRLLNTSTIKVDEFFDNAIPKYAILSHTWGAEEVTFQDMLGAAPSHKKGYQKLLYSCKQARSDDLEYIWIDTCCIDKSSSAELSEAINSMFRWYKMSSICYIYLSDFQNTSDLGSLGSSFEKIGWFTRGWTLQELIAPKSRIFFSEDWTAIGRVDTPGAPLFSFQYMHLSEMSTLIGEITGIDVEILAGAKLSDISIARRMSWATNRKTTRTEDTAYCLMGIFDINMPLLYGEGMKAFKRLQEEILKSSDDDSIFAHTASIWDTTDPSFPSILAQSPACFSGWEHVGTSQGESRELLAPSIPATLTSRGLRIQLPLCWHTGRLSDENSCIALLNCTIGENSLARLGIPLIRLPSSRDQFRRLGGHWLSLLSPGRDGPESALLAECYGGKPLAVTGKTHLRSVASGQFSRSCVSMRSLVNRREVNRESLRIGDVRLETIYVVSEEYSLKKKVRTAPYFQLKSILEPPESFLRLENVYPRECWDKKGCVLRTRPIQGLDNAWVSGVISLRDERIGRVLDIILGGNSRNSEQPGQSLQAFLEPWCLVTSVDDLVCEMPDSSDTRLKEQFDAVRYERDGGNISLPIASWIGSLMAKVTFETTEFLGRQGFAVQIEIS